MQEIGRGDRRRVNGPQRSKKAVRDIATLARTFGLIPKAKACNELSLRCKNCHMMDVRKLAISRRGGVREDAESIFLKLAD